MRLLNVKNKLWNDCLSQVWNQVPNQLWLQAMSIDLTIDRQVHQVLRQVLNSLCIFL